MPCTNNKPSVWCKIMQFLLANHSDLCVTHTIWQAHAYTNFIRSIPVRVTLKCINEFFVIHMHTYLMSVVCNKSLHVYVSLNDNRVLILLHCRSSLPIQNTSYTSSLFGILYCYLSLFNAIHVLILLSCFSLFAPTTQASLLYCWNIIDKNAYTLCKNRKKRKVPAVQ
jgi:hypothetical protein